ncbi:MAG: heat-inducible transcriptional repressor HrcA [Proteobacteria bacterium]|nr:heat-inducible transcriptional repressor HrcA [Pseudomonadota bacterium]
MSDFLNERDRQILQSLIDEYILTAEPVGSRRISKKYHLELSSATIRNVMADLAEMGYLHQPHTSAGRIPTDKGFRFYVDSILEMRELTRGEKEYIRKKYEISTMDVSDIMKETSLALSKLSQNISIIMAPKFTSTVLKHLEFLKISESRVLVILVSQSGIVQNKIIEAEEDISQDDLNRYTNYLNELFAGLSLEEVREKLIEEMTKEKAMYDELLSKALKLGEQALYEEEEAEVYIEGKNNIFNYPEFTEIEKMRALFNTFEEKSRMVKLLNKTLVAKGVQIFIGSENQLPELQDCALITSSFSRGKQVLGTLGVIGPTRIQYCKIIPIVDYTAKLISKILEMKY